jgi:hypothetical protein
MKAHCPRLFLSLFAAILCSCGGGGQPIGGGPGFAITPSPSNLPVVPGGSNVETVTVFPANGFRGSVAVSISNLPAGVTATPATLNFTISGAPVSQPMTISAAPDAGLENVGLVLTGTSGNLNASANITLQVQPLSVTTWHYDTARTGVNQYETALTFTSVNPNTFGKLFVLPTDGAIIGQVLYVPNVATAGKGVHNVVYAATMHDSVYAFDADSNLGANTSPLWQVSLLPQGATPVPMSVQQCQAVTEWAEVGVVSTPVIDPATGTFYVVAKSYENGAAVFRVHALDVTSGKEKLGGPVTISATYTLNGNSDAFSAQAETNRPALLLTNGHIYLAFGSNGCNDSGSKGWVLSYNATTLALEGAFTTEPGKSLAAIWGKGAGLSADSSFNIYAETGGGFFNPGTNFGASVLRLGASGSNLLVGDWFTPYNVDFLSQNDLDLNDAVLVLPDQPGPHKHLALAVGKEGTLYLLDRDNMGHFCTTCNAGDTQIVQELIQAVGKHTGSLVYWNSTVYSTGTASPIMGWALSNGMLSSSPIVQTPTQAGGHSPVITSSGTSNGILWQINGSNLAAYNATTLTVLYVTSETNGRDDLPPLPHFAQLMVVNGKVYVSTESGIAVLGLF